MPASMFTRSMVIVALTFILGLSLHFGSSLAQVAGPKAPLPKGFPADQPDPTPNSGTSAIYSAIKLTGDPKLGLELDAARDRIKVKSWKGAVDSLQSVLDREGNFYVQVRDRDNNGRETIRWASVKIEATNMLGGLGEEGLEVYEQEYGGKARDLLNEAKKKGDRETIAKVAEAYMYTKAGIEANDLLATSFLDRGEYFVAALRLEKILDMNPARTRLSDLTLLKAALAYSRSGDTNRFQEAWKRLETRARDGLRIDDKLVPLAQLKEIAAEKPRSFINPFDWPTIRGNPQNSGQAIGGQPALDYTAFAPRSTVLVVDSNDGLAGPAGLAACTAAKGLLDGAIREQQGLGGAVLPGFFPIVTDKMAIFRTHKDIHAIALRNIKDSAGNDIPAGGIVCATAAIAPSSTLWRIPNCTCSAAACWRSSTACRVINPSFTKTL